MEYFDLSRSNVDPPVAVNPGTSSMTEYASFELYDQLAYSISNWLHISKENILFGNGTAELIDTISSIVKGKKVCVFSPAFFLYERFAKKYCKTITLMDWAWENIQMDIICNASLVWITNPNNPTNNQLDTDTILYIISKSKGIVVIDESFIEFSRESICNHIEGVGNAIVLRSFSKSFGIAGSRLGYLIGSPNLINRISEHKDPISANRHSVEIALNILKFSMQEYSIKWNWIKKTIKELSNLLLSDDYEVLTGNTSFLTLKFDHYTSAKLFSDIGKMNRLKFKNGWSWEFSGNSRHLIRIGVPPENQKDEIYKKITGTKKQFENELKNSA